MRRTCFQIYGMMVLSKFNVVVSHSFYSTNHSSVKIMNIILIVRINFYSPHKKTQVTER